MNVIELNHARIEKKFFQYARVVVVKRRYPISNGFVSDAIEKRRLALSCVSFFFVILRFI